MPGTSRFGKPDGRQRICRYSGLVAQIVGAIHPPSLAHALPFSFEGVRLDTVVKPEVVMASETELFYLVLLTLLTLIIHLILSTKHRRDERHSHR